LHSTIALIGAVSYNTIGVVGFSSERHTMFKNKAQAVANNKIIFFI
jgi:hypothetical protein